MLKDYVTLTQSSISRGTWLLGFQEVVGGLVSHLRTEGDRGGGLQDQGGMIDRFFGRATVVRGLSGLLLKNIQPFLFDDL